MCKYVRSASLLPSSISFSIRPGERIIPLLVGKKDLTTANDFLRPTSGIIMFKYGSCSSNHSESWIFICDTTCWAFIPNSAFFIMATRITRYPRMQPRSSIFGDTVDDFRFIKSDFAVYHIIISRASSAFRTNIAIMLDPVPFKDILVIGSGKMVSL